MNAAPTAAAASMARPAWAVTSTCSAMPASATLASDQLHPLVDREQPAGLLVVVHHGDGDVAEQLDALLDDVEVPEVDRVEAAGVEHGRHGCRKRSAGAGDGVSAASVVGAVEERHPRPAVALDPALLPVRRRRHLARRPRRRRGRPRTARSSRGQSSKPYGGSANTRSTSSRGAVAMPSPTTTRLRSREAERGDVLVDRARRRRGRARRTCSARRRATAPRCRAPRCRRRGRRRVRRRRRRGWRGR